ncbi:MAG: class I SAM-dependent methyltransferase [Bradymonadaceae bacterium]
MFDERGPTFIELTRQALSSTTRGYDLLAPKFDYTPFRTPDELLEPMAQIIGPERSIECALDVACGTGAVMRVLRPLCRSHVTGIDLSQGMLDEAERRLEDAPGDAEIRLEQQDVFAMEFDEEFDIITCAGAFGHILQDDQDAFARRVRAALKPGGRFVFVTHLMPPVSSKAWWMARGFNAVMHVRNFVLRPPFIMFYLTFSVERALEVLPGHGFSIEVMAPFEAPFQGMRVVIATRD